MTTEPKDISIDEQIKEKILAILRDPTKGEWSRETIAERTRQQKADKLMALFAEHSKRRETELLDALYWMYVQYCSKGHLFMGAGETASEILEDAGYIKVFNDGKISIDNGDSYDRAK